MPNPIADFIFRRFSNCLYVRFDATAIRITNVNTGETIRETPFVLLSKPSNSRAKGKIPKVLAIGEQAQRLHAQQTDSTTLHNGFDHPRICIGSFDLAMDCLRYLFQRAMKRFAFIRPHVIMHPLYPYSTDLSQIELRAIRELAEACGAMQVHVYTGSPLTLDQLKRKTYLKHS